MGAVQKSQTTSLLHATALHQRLQVRGKGMAMDRSSSLNLEALKEVGAVPPELHHSTGRCSARSALGRSGMRNGVIPVACHCRVIGTAQQASVSSGTPGQCRKDAKLNKV